MTDCHHLENRSLTTAFLGGGPCPELYGLMHCLKNSDSQITRISAAMFDFASVYWKFNRGIVRKSLLNQIWNPGLYKFLDFESDLTAAGSGFLQPTSERWVKGSDLIVIQCCLNEIPTSKHKQVLMNITGVIDIMKHGALMLIIERQGHDELFEKLRDKIEKTKGVGICHDEDSIGVKYLNDNNIPPELIEHLFLKKFDSGLWLANDIYIRHIHPLAGYIQVTIGYDMWL